MSKMKDEQKGILFIGIIATIILVVIFMFSLILKENSVEESIKNSSVLRVLFVVEDDNKDVLFSSIIICDTISKNVALFNLPENVGAIFNTLGRVDKLQVVYNELGIESYKQEVEKLTGAKIPFHIVVNMQNFIKLADYLGGMRIFISEPIDYTDEDNNRWLLPSGAINLDGDKIYEYLHYTYENSTNSDLQERYQNVMQAFMSALNDKRLEILNKDNFKIYESCFATGLTKEETKSLIEIITNVNIESVIRQSVTGLIRNVDGQQLLMPYNNGDFVKDAIKQTTNMLSASDGASSSHVYVLEIMNGTTVQGLARNTSILFQNASYDVLASKNADRNDYEETIIIDHYGNDSVAKMISEFIHCDNIVQERDINIEDLGSDENVDFTIILGKDFDGRYVVKRKR